MPGSTHLTHPDNRAFSACGAYFSAPENTNMTDDPAGVNCPACIPMGRDETRVAAVLVTPDWVRDQAVETLMRQLSEQLGWANPGETGVRYEANMHAGRGRHGTAGDLLVEVQRVEGMTRTSVGVFHLQVTVRRAGT